MINFTAGELELIRAFDLLPKEEKHSSYWNSDEINSIRARIKSFFVRRQERKCCYCRQTIASDHGRIWDVEHIVCRTKYPEFMFEERNLAVSCIDCNTHKSDREVLTRKRSNYQDDPNVYKIVHPHFDTYSDHIRLEGDLYLPLSDKGRFTIYACDLMRYIQRKMGLSQSVLDQRFEAVVDTVFRAEPSSEAVAQAVEEVTDIIERFGG